VHTSHCRAVMLQRICTGGVQWCCYYRVSMHACKRIHIYCNTSSAVHCSALRCRYTVSACACMHACMPQVLSYTLLIVVYHCCYYRVCMHACMPQVLSYTLVIVVYHCMHATSAIIYSSNSSISLLLSQCSCMHACHK
jgi:hypothetical protein